MVVIAREGGRSSIPETVVIHRDAAAYWIPRLRGVWRGQSRLFQPPVHQVETTDRL